MAVGGAGGGPRSYTEAYDKMSVKFETAQKALEKEINGLKADDPTYLFKLSKAMTKWSLAIQTQSQVMKEFSDALKGIIQKM